MSQDTSNGKKSLEFEYKDPHDYINRQSNRAKWLIRWFVAGLVITAVLYFAFHLWWFNPAEPGKWYAVTSDSARSQRALDWVLWSLAGTLVYLLVEAGRHYQAIGENARKGSTSSSYPISFIEKTPWNLVTLIKGPIIAVVLLFFFNAADLKLTKGTEPAFSFDFSKLDHPVTLLLAFVLGFYGRVALEVLNSIMKTLFAKPWAEAYGSFKIEPSDAKIVLGETMMFKTTPTTDVVWAASLGTIDATGKYDAPKEREHCGAKAVITAVSTGTSSIARSATVTLVPFKIEGLKEVELGSEEMQYAYSVSPAVDVDEWTISPVDGGGRIDKKTGTYTAPSKDDAKTEKVTITATKTEEGQKCSDSLEVTLKKKEEGQ